MFGRYFFLSAAALAGVAVLYSIGISQQNNENPYGAINGVNNTILFLSNHEHGLANVLLASSYALLVHHSNVQVHFASFYKREADVARIFERAHNIAPDAKPITFHTLTGPNYGDALTSTGHFVREAIHSPGVIGSAKLCKDMQKYLMPWSGPEYLGLYQQISHIIDEVDPAVIALDPLFGPGLDATKDKKRKHAIVSPNSLRDSFAQMQPWGSMFWKYPAMGSGYPFPVPWHLIPANIFMNLRFIYSVLVTPALGEKKKFLKEHGVADPNNFFSVYHEHMTWICQSAREADFPMDVVPKNVEACGPISLSTASAAEQDAELASWLEQAPTVLINLGSSVDYDEEDATEMAKAIDILFQKTDVQVLWKFNRRRYDQDSVANFTNAFLGPLQDVLGTRLRLEKWISIDPATMLKTGNIAASVHHGGASCYHEAVGNGIPQIVLAKWADLYDYGARVDWLDVGVWGNKATAPSWTSDELSKAFLQVLGDDEAGKAMRKKAKDLGTLLQQKPGDVCAANELARLAKLD